MRLISQHECQQLSGGLALATTLGIINGSKDNEYDATVKYGFIINAAAGGLVMLASSLRNNNFITSTAAAMIGATLYGYIGYLEASAGYWIGSKFA